MSITISDGVHEFLMQVKPDGGADESLISTSVAENAIRLGIGAIREIPPVFLKGPGKKANQTPPYFFSRIYSAPWVVVHLAVGRLAMVNVKLLVVDNELDPDLYIGRPVLRHMQEVDIKSMLEQNCSALDWIGLTVHTSAIPRCRVPPAPSAE